MNARVNCTKYLVKHFQRCSSCLPSWYTKIIHYIQNKLFNKGIMRQCDIYFHRLNNPYFIFREIELKFHKEIVSFLKYSYSP